MSVCRSGYWNVLDSHVIGRSPGRGATSWPLTSWPLTPRATSNNMRIQHISISKLDSYSPRGYCFHQRCSSCYLPTTIYIIFTIAGSFSQMSDLELFWLLGPLCNNVQLTLMFRIFLKMIFYIYSVLIQGFLPGGGGVRTPPPLSISGGRGYIPPCWQRKWN